MQVMILIFKLVNKKKKIAINAVYRAINEKEVFENKNLLL